MTKEKTVRLTKFELEVMRSLWELKSASIREMQEGLPENRRPAYTTVQTIVRRLEEKGAVRRTKKIGNAFIFEAVISQGAAHRRLVGDLLEVFGGSARPLMAHLAESGKLTMEDLREMEALLNQQATSSAAKDQTQKRRTKEHR